jgi:hypothetical protein
MNNEVELYRQAQHNHSWETSISRLNATRKRLDAAKYGGLSAADAALLRGDFGTVTSYHLHGSYACVCGRQFGQLNAFIRHSGYSLGASGAGTVAQSYSCYAKTVSEAVKLLEKEVEVWTDVERNRIGAEEAAKVAKEKAAAGVAVRVARLKAIALRGGGGGGSANGSFRAVCETVVARATAAGELSGSKLTWANLPPAIEAQVWLLGVRSSPFARSLLSRALSFSVCFLLCIHAHALSLCATDDVEAFN